MNIYNKRDMWNVNTSVLTKNPSTGGVIPAISFRIFSDFPVFTRVHFETVHLQNSVNLTSP